MKLSRYFNYMLAFVSAIILVTILIIYFSLMQIFNTFLDTEQRTAINNIKTQVISILTEDDDIKTSSMRLQRFLAGSHYAIVIEDAQGNTVLGQGDYMHGRNVYHNRLNKNHLDKPPFNIIKSIQLDSSIIQTDRGNYTLKIYLLQAVETNTSTKNFKRGLLIALICTTVVGFGSVMIIGRKMTNRVKKPLQRATYNARQITQGNFDISVATHTNICELDALNTSIVHMAQSLSVQRALRSRMVDEMSHEIKTPIAIIKGHIEACQDDVLPFDDKMARIISDEVDELSSLVNDLEEMQALSNTYDKLAIQAVDMTQLTNDLLDRVSYAYAKRNLTINRQIAPNVIFSTDKKRMRSLILNLLINAQKYSLSGTEVIVRLTPDNGYLLEIINIKPQDIMLDINKLGTIGYRGGLKSIEGKGLGLYLVKDIALQLGLRINFDSNVSTFSVRVCSK